MEKGYKNEQLNNSQEFYTTLRDVEVQYNEAKGTIGYIESLKQFAPEQFSMIEKNFNFSFDKLRNEFDTLYSDYNNVIAKILKSITANDDLFDAFKSFLSDDEFEYITAESDVHQDFSIYIKKTKGFQDFIDQKLQKVFPNLYSQLILAQEDLHGIINSENFQKLSYLEDQHFNGEDLNSAISSLLQENSTIDDSIYNVVLNQKEKVATVIHKAGKILQGKTFGKDEGFYDDAKESYQKVQESFSKIDHGDVVLEDLTYKNIHGLRRYLPFISNSALRKDLQARIDLFEDFAYEKYQMSEDDYKQLDKVAGSLGLDMIFLERYNDDLLEAKNNYLQESFFENLDDYIEIITFDPAFTSFKDDFKVILDVIQSFPSKDLQEKDLQSKIFETILNDSSKKRAYNTILTILPELNKVREFKSLEQSQAFKTLENYVSKHESEALTPGELEEVGDGKELVEEHARERRKYERELRTLIIKEDAKGLLNNLELLKGFEKRVQEIVTAIIGFAEDADIVSVKENKYQITAQEAVKLLNPYLLTLSNEIDNDVLREWINVVYKFSYIKNATGLDAQKKIDRIQSEVAAIKNRLFPKGEKYLDEDLKKQQIQKSIYFLKGELESENTSEDKILELRDNLEESLVETNSIFDYYQKAKIVLKNLEKDTLLGSRSKEYRKKIIEKCALIVLRLCGKEVVLKDGQYLCEANLVNNNPAKVGADIITDILKSDLDVLAYQKVFNEYGASSLLELFEKYNEDFDARSEIKSLEAIEITGLKIELNALENDGYIVARESYIEDLEYAFENADKKPIGPMAKFAQVKYTSIELAELEDQKSTLSEKEYLEEKVGLLQLQKGLLEELTLEYLQKYQLENQVDNFGVRFGRKSGENSPLKFEFKVTGGNSDIILKSIGEPELELAESQYEALEKLQNKIENKKIKESIENLINSYQAIFSIPNYHNALDNIKFEILGRLNSIVEDIMPQLMKIDDFIQNIDENGRYVDGKFMNGQYEYIKKFLTVDGFSFFAKSHDLMKKNQAAFVYDHNFDVLESVKVETLRYLNSELALFNDFSRVEKEVSMQKDLQYMQSEGRIEKEQQDNYANRIHPYFDAFKAWNNNEVKVYSSEEIDELDSENLPQHFYELPQIIKQILKGKTMPSIDGQAFSSYFPELDKDENSLVLLKMLQKEYQYLLSEKLTSGNRFKKIYFGLISFIDKNLVEANDGEMNVYYQTFSKDIDEVHQVLGLLVKDRSLRKNYAKFKSLYDFLDIFLKEDSDGNNKVDLSKISPDEYEEAKKLMNDLLNNFPNDFEKLKNNSLRSVFDIESHLVTEGSELLEQQYDEIKNVVDEVFELNNDYINSLRESEGGIVESASKDKLWAVKVSPEDFIERLKALKLDLTSKDYKFIANVYMGEITGRVQNIPFEPRLFHIPKVRYILDLMQYNQGIYRASDAFEPEKRYESVAQTLKDFALMIEKVNLDKDLPEFIKNELNSHITQQYLSIANMQQYEIDALLREYSIVDPEMRMYRKFIDMSLKDTPEYLSSYIDNVDLIKSYYKKFKDGETLQIFYKESDGEGGYIPFTLKNIDENGLFTYEHIDSERGLVQPWKFHFKNVGDRKYLLQQMRNGDAEEKKGINEFA